MTRAEESEARSDLPGKWTAIGLLALCEVLCLGMWFSLSAVIPSLHAEFALDDTTASLYSSAVAVGFVAGTLASAVLGLADRIDPRRLFMTAALVAAAANGAILLTDPTQHAVIALRFITGACMAGVYPVGMKMASSWARADMGLLIGLLVGALTLGTAAPHLFNAFGGVDWRATLMLASAAAVLAALLVSFVRLGPNQRPAPPFQPSIVLDAWRNKALRLANFGYFGHMWELYAMWAWIGVFFQASFTERLADGDAALYAKLATFAVIAAGAGGCLLGGMIADRLGRTTLTMGAMMVSGTCAAFAGFLFGAAPWLVITGRCGLGGGDRCRFSSVLLERDGAFGARSGGNDGDRADVDRLLTDAGNDSSAANSGRPGWLGVGVCCPGESDPRLARSRCTVYANIPKAPSSQAGDASSLRAAQDWAASRGRDHPSGWRRFRGANFSPRPYTPRRGSRRSWPQNAGGIPFY